MSDLKLYKKLQRLYALRGRPTISPRESALLADAIDVDQDLERVHSGLDHIASDIRMIDAHEQRAKGSPESVALASRSTADGAVQIRQVGSDAEVKPPEPPAPHVVARRNELSDSYRVREQGRREAAERQRQADWKEHRKQALASQAKLRADAFLNPDPNVVFAFAAYDLPLTAPSWFGKRDGEVRYFAPIEDEGEKINDDGTRTIRSRLNLITGRPHGKPAAPAKSPAQVFGDAPS